MSDTTLAANVRPTRSMTPFARAFAAIGSTLARIAELSDAARAARHAAQLAELSDAELADRGLTRDEIVAHAFRHLAVRG